MRLALWLALLASPVQAQTDSVRAFALDTNARHLDSVIARATKDSTVRTQRNGPNVVIWTAPYARLFQLRDSLRVWCTGSCRWEWDTVVPVDSLREEAGSPSAVNTWGVEAIGAPAAWAMGAKGQGVIVTSLDSGIDPTHPGYTVAGGWNAVARADTGWADNIGGCNGHGTHVGGTLAGKTVGVAPEARLFGVKVFEPIPCGSYVSSQIAGLQWAVANGSRCVNISISGGQSYSMNAAVTNARAAGVLVSRANGNSGTTPPQGTALEIQTAALNGSGRSGFSNYGDSPQTDLAAPGEGVVSTMPGGGYGTKSGTSMAAPHVCGAAALVMSADPQLSADSVFALLTRSAQPLGSPIPNGYTGWGRVRPDRAIALHRGGVWIAGDTLQMVEGFQEKCFPMVATRPYTVGVTVGVQWRQVGDNICLTLGESTPRQITVVVQ